MTRDNNSIGEHINRLARETRASSSFVTRVRALFSRKGISLDSDCHPYAEALENAFVRERMIRERADETRERIEKLQEQLVEVSSAFNGHLERLKKIQAALNRKFPVSGHTKPAAKTTDAGHKPRTRRVRLQVDKGFLVPGPEDVQ